MPLQHYIEQEELKELAMFVKRVDEFKQHTGIVRTIKALMANHEVLTETFVDEKNNTWTRPTPEAYAKTCMLRDKYEARSKELEKKLMSQFTQYGQEQMYMAFENVQNKENWKNPIDATIDDPGEENLACLRAAITHFTGSVPHFDKSVAVTCT